MAELMALPHVSQVRKLDFRADGKSILVERVTDEGHQVIKCPLPAVVCVTEGIAPELFANREEMEAAQEKPIEELACSDLSSDLSIFGAAGSPTWVEDIRLVEPNRLGEVIADAEPQAAAQQVADQLKARLQSIAAQNASSASPPDTARYPDVRDRSIWVVAETAGDTLRHVTLEMLGNARELALSTHSQVAAVLIGKFDHDLTSDLGIYGADRVLTLDNSNLGPICSRSVSQALADTIEAAQPYAVLFAATADGRDLASRIAARLKLGLTGDAIDLEMTPRGAWCSSNPPWGAMLSRPFCPRLCPI